MIPLTLFADLIERHSADGNAHFVDDALADDVNVGAGGQIHDGIGTVFDGVLHFGNFAGGIAGKSVQILLSPDSFILYSV